MGSGRIPIEQTPESPISGRESKCSRNQDMTDTNRSCRAPWTECISRMRSFSHIRGSNPTPKPSATPCRQMVAFGDRRMCLSTPKPNCQARIGDTVCPGPHHMLAPERALTEAPNKSFWSMRLGLGRHSRWRATENFALSRDVDDLDQFSDIWWRAQCCSNMASPNRQDRRRGDKPAGQG